MSCNVSMCLGFRLSVRINEVIASTHLGIKLSGKCSNYDFQHVTASLLCHECLIGYEMKSAENLQNSNFHRSYRSGKNLGAIVIASIIIEVKLCTMYIKSVCKGAVVVTSSTWLLCYNNCNS